MSYEDILVVSFSPLLNQYLGFFKCRKDFPVKQLIFELEESGRLAVKGFNITVLPKAAWFNIQGFDFYSA